MGCCSKGDSEEEEFAGPTSKRSCTDILCLLIFVAFLGGLGFVVYSSLVTGNPYRLLYGVDSYGNTCNQKNDLIENASFSGIDMTGLTKTFYFDFKAVAQPDLFSSQVLCISECPGNETIVLPSDFQDYYEETNISLCRYDIDLSDGPPSLGEMDLCAPVPVLPHKDLLNRCVPLVALEIGKSIFSSFTDTASASLAAIKTTCDDAGSFYEKCFNDLKKSWREIGYLTAVSVGVSFILVLLLRFLAAIIIWTLVIGSALGALGAAGFCWYNWYLYKTELDKIPADEQLEEEKKYVQNWMIYAAVVSGVGLIIILILLVMRKRIALVVQLFREAGAAVGKMPLILLQPLWTLLALIAVLGGLTYGFMYVYTAGIPTVGNDGFVKYELDEQMFYFRWYYLFGALWLIQFVFACQQMVVAGAVATWYFDRDKDAHGCCSSERCPIARATWRLIRYHLGTVAFGSFIIALVQFIRMILGYIHRKLHGKSNPIVNVILKVLMCCLWCFEKILKFINKNAYIMCAIHGYSFCKSAQKALSVIVDNILRIGAINSVGAFCLLLGKIGVTAIVVVIGLQFFKDADLCYLFVPLIAVGLIALIIAHCFISIYGMAIDTIFLCFCVDCNRNDGVRKPYYMRMGLMNFVENSGVALRIVKVREANESRVAEDMDEEMIVEDVPKKRVRRKKKKKKVTRATHGSKVGASNVTDVAW